MRTTHALMALAAVSCACAGIKRTRTSSGGDDGKYVAASPRSESESDSASRSESSGAVTGVASDEAPSDRPAPPREAELAEPRSPAGADKEEKDTGPIEKKTTTEPLIERESGKGRTLDERAHDDASRSGGAKPDAAVPDVPRPSKPPASAGVKAGASDDNMQFNAFLRFVDENAGIGLRHDVSHRIVVTVTDKGGLPVANAEVSAVSGATTLTRRRTYADGRAMLFPSADARLRSQDAELVVTGLGVTQRMPLAGPLLRKVTLDAERTATPSVPLDIVFVLDTTGSMGDEIEQLRKTIQVIHWQISNMSPRPDVRFGMVLFKDQEDEYVTRVVPFTGDLARFQSELSAVTAGGGGDTPEDVEAALEVLVNALPWRTDGLRLAFLIGDAPPHLDYPRRFNYVLAMQEAAAKGIKITSIGASGLDRQGELIWRQIAQYTMAPFVFLTYGETADTEGSPSSVSHHVGSNWVADSLDAIVIKMVKVELGHFAARGAPLREDFFEAVASGALGAELVLDDLFRQSVKQLMDYSVEPIPDRSPTSVLPVAAKKAELEKKAEKLASRLELAFGRARSFQLIETKATPKLMELVAIQMGPSFDSGSMVEVGKLVPARFAVLSHLDEATDGLLELVVKLVRLETGEVVSMSLLKIDRKLLG